MMTTRAELTGPWPPGTPDGKCIITRFEDGRMRIDRADPRILISAELLAEILAAPCPGVTLTRPPRNGFPREGGYWEGSVLRIEAVNRTVIYQITDYVRSVHGYVGQWPD